MKTYALITDNIVVNLIYLSEENAHEFTDAVDINDYLVDIGDTYSDGVFYHDGSEVMTFEEYKERVAQVRLLEEMDEAYREGVNSL